MIVNLKFKSTVILITFAVAMCLVGLAAGVSSNAPEVKALVEVAMAAPPNEAANRNAIEGSNQKDEG